MLALETKSGITETTFPVILPLPSLAHELPGVFKESRGNSLLSSLNLSFQSYHCLPSYLTKLSGRPNQGVGKGSFYRYFAYQHLGVLSSLNKFELGGGC